MESLDADALDAQLYDLVVLVSNRKRSLLPGRHHGRTAVVSFGIAPGRPAQIKPSSPASFGQLQNARRAQIAGTAE